MQQIDLKTNASEEISADAFSHLYAWTHTQLAYDDHTGQLWYSDSHTAIRTLDVRTQQQGGGLGGFADAALVGCAAVGDGRPIALDAARRRLFVPVATGGVLVYDLDSLHLLTVISASALDTEAGLLPALAVDARTGALWYGTRNGTIAELTGAGYQPSGRSLAYAHDPHTLRSLTAVGGRLFATGTDGSLRAFDLTTGREDTVPRSIASVGPAETFNR